MPRYAATLQRNPVGDDFNTVAQAKAAVQRSFGGRPLRWSRQDIGRGSIEHYVAEDTQFAPDDLGGALSGWFEAGMALSTFGGSTASGTPVRQWGDLSRSNNPAVQSDSAHAPKLRSEGEINFFAALGELYLDIDNALPAEFTIQLVTRAGAFLATQQAVATDQAVLDVIPSPLRWRYTRGATIITASATTTSMVTLRQRSADADVRVNGGATSSGAAASAVSTSPIRLASETRATSWLGFFYRVVIVNRAISDGERDALEADARRRYPIIPAAP